MNQSLNTTQRAAGWDQSHLWGPRGAEQETTRANPPNTAQTKTCSSTNGAPSAEGKPRVLLVDDEENILASLRRLLRREPYELFSADSGENALRVMESDPVHLIVTDYRMPGMTGTELLQEVQQRWPDTVRIVLSGYSEIKAIISAINEGAIYKFITKPWNDEEIKLNIRRALEQHMLEAENKRMAAEIGRQNEQLRKFNKLLDQRATDASTGLTCAQELLETLDVGVLTIDKAGLIVGANVRATQLAPKGRTEFIGVAAHTVLPDHLHKAILPQAVLNAASALGRFEHEGRTLQWRSQPLEVDGNRRATVVAVWEDVPCPSN